MMPTDDTLEAERSLGPDETDTVTLNCLWAVLITSKYVTFCVF